MNILIINLHSALNLGDESIMRVTLNFLRGKYGEANITLMANDPQSWNLFLNVNVISSLINYFEYPKPLILKAIRFIKIVFMLFLGKYFIKLLNKKKDLFKIVETINKADIIYSCGGGNFYSNTFFGSNLMINLITIIYSGILSKKIIFLPQSFGPFNNRFHKLLVKTALKYPQIIYVRESLSFKLLVDIGVSVEKLKIIPDLALSLPLKNNYKANFNSNEINVGITILNRSAQTRNYSGQLDYLKVFCNYINYLVQAEKFSVSLFVQCYGPSYDQNDEIVTTSLYNKLKAISPRIALLSGYKDSISLIEDLSRMDILVATRMHTAIFGLINCLPTLLIGYQPKSEGLFKLFEIQEFYIDIEKLNFSFLVSNTEKIIQNYCDIKNRISNKLTKISNSIRTEMLRR